MPVGPASVAHVANFDLDIVSQLRSSPHLGRVFIVLDVPGRAWLQIWRVKQSLEHLPFGLVIPIDTPGCRLFRLRQAVLLHVDIVYIHIDIDVVVLFCCLSIQVLSLRFVS